MWGLIGDFNRQQGDFETSLVRADFNKKSNNFKEAALDYEHYLKFNPSNPVPYFSLADCYYFLNNIDNAVDSFKKGLSLIKSEPPESLLINYATILMVNKQFEESLVIVNKILINNSKSANAYLLKGQIYREINDGGKAFYFFTKAIEINSNFWNAWAERATVDYELNDFDREIEDFKNAFSLNKNLPAAFHTTHALALYKLGRNDEAKKQFELSIKLGDPVAERFYNKYFR